MSIEKGRAYFRALGLEDRVQEFSVSSATVELAAQALGVEGARIAKTLSFKTEEVLELVGHPVGGVCPFGCNEGIPVYLDESLKRFETVFPAVGSASSAIELNLDKLYRYSKALAWIDVCKLPEDGKA